MPRKEIAEGELLYHAVHGLCRLDRKIQQSEAGKKVLCYAVVPKKSNKMKIRFVIQAQEMQSSGFHSLVTLAEANRIMDYLKAGDTTASFANQNETWSLAQTVLSVSRDKPEPKDAKDQRKRAMLARSVKGLLGELAAVFNISIQEAAERMQKSLGRASKINPMVITAMTHAVED